DERGFFQFGHSKDRDDTSRPGGRNRRRMFFQFGHSKDRDDLPQIKVAVATLDPLGLPLTTFGVPVTCAPDPLCVPQIKQVHVACVPGVKAFVTDCKGAALATRAYLAQSGDYYLCPLSENHVSAQDRRALLQPVWQGRQTLGRVYRPAAAGEPE